MGRIIKIIFSCGFIVALILLFVNGFSQAPISDLAEMPSGTVSSATSTFFSFVGNSVRNVRGAINYFISDVFGAPAITIFNILIWISSVGVLFFLSLKVSVFVHRLIGIF